MSRKLRICLGGIDGDAPAGIERLLREVRAYDCEPADESGADLALIDTDGELGPHLLTAHRLLFPDRPIIRLAQDEGPPGANNLAVWLAKPARAASLEAALARALANAPAHLAREPEATWATEANLPALFVGGQPDLEDAQAVESPRVCYAPDRFLQGLLDDAIGLARRTRQPTTLIHLGRPLLHVREDGRAYRTALGPAGLRALALFPLARQDFRIVEASNPATSAWQPIVPLRWELALLAARGRIPAGVPLDAPVRLHYWPNLTRLGLPPDAIRVAGLWSGRPTALLATARLLGIPQRHVFAFFSACHAIGAASCDPLPAARPAVAETAAPRRRGQFNRLLGRLLGRRDVAPGDTGQ